MISSVILICMIALAMAKVLYSMNDHHHVAESMATIEQPGEKKEAPLAKSMAAKPVQEPPVATRAGAGLMPLTEAWGHFKRGERFLAKVKDVRREAVEVIMPDDRGCGLISACCWGTGEDRVAALAALSVGDTLEVVVRSYDSSNRNLSLILPGCKNLMPDSEKCDSKVSRKRKQAKHSQNNAHDVAVKPMKKSVKKLAKKPDYHPIPSGTTFLIDTANVIGALGPEQAAHKLSVIKDALVAHGYKAVFFLEYRSLSWMCGNQDSESEVAALKAFCSKPNVSKVSGEADLPILQAASEIPDSVIVSRDHFDDYRGTYPDVVGSDRHCTCSSAVIDGKTFFTIRGLRDAIVIDNGPEEILVLEDRPEPQDKPIAPMSALRKGLLGAGDACRTKGDFEKAIACYSRIAHKVPSAYFDIAQIYADAYRVDLTAQKYVKLGERDARKTRQCAMRQARIRAERRRIGASNTGWMRAA